MSKALPLHDLQFLAELGCGREGKLADAGGVISSELFIARVLRVEKAESKETDEDEDIPRTLPLLYHRRGYTSCIPTAPPNST